jgi:hypothetical protein
VKALVLPSPFLPGLAYEPWLASLRARGLDAVLAPVPTPPRAEELVHRWSDLGDHDTVLLPHSNAGYCAPAVAGATGAAVVFVDAALPDRGPVTRLAPTPFRELLGGLAEDGRLPRWTRWWPRTDYADVLPGPWFDRIDEAAPRVPLAYVEAEVPVPAGWEQGRCAYLAFGDTYAEEWDRAGEAGWSRRRLDGGHLHWLVEPDQVTDAVLELFPNTR